MFTEHTIFWQLGIIAKKAITLQFSCDKSKNASIIASLTGAFSYEQPGLAGDTVHAQQFNLFYIPVVNCVAQLKEGEHRLFGVCYTHDFLVQYAHDNKILKSFIEQVATNRPTVATEYPVDLSEMMRVTIDEIVYTRLNGFDLNCFLQARAFDILRLSMEKIAASKSPAVSSTALTDVESVKEVHNWLLKHLGEYHTLPGLAKRAGINVTKFQINFHDLYDISPIAFIRRERLLRAKQQLAEGGMNIKSVAAHAGYKRLPSFTAAFLSAFHMTPAQMRKPGTK